MVRDPRYLLIFAVNVTVTLDKNDISGPFYEIGRFYTVWARNNLIRHQFINLDEIE